MRAVCGCQWQVLLITSDCSHSFSDVGSLWLFCVNLKTPTYFLRSLTGPSQHLRVRLTSLTLFNLYCTELYGAYTTSVSLTGATT